jgi:general secretion pathway protein K
MKNKLKVNGSAILTALFIMILVAISATAMSLLLQIDINRTQLIKQQFKLQLAANKAVLLAIKQLSKNAAKLSSKNANIDNNINKTKQLTIDDFTIKSHLIDLQGRFNLNSLVSKDRGPKNTKQNDSVKKLALLLIAANPNLEPINALAISKATFDWVNPLDRNKGYMPLDKFSANIGYRQAHRPMISISEFRLIKGVNQHIYNRTVPHLSALPENVAININSATLTVLRTIGPGLSSKEAKLIIDARGKKGFDSLEILKKDSHLRQLEIGNDFTTLTSNYFLSVVHIFNKNHRVIYYTLLKRQIERTKLSVSTLSQSINTY